MTGTGWSVTIVRAVSQSQILTRPRRIAYRTMPAMFGVSSFLKMCARWDSAVLTLIPRASATSFVVLPSATSYRTSRSRGVSGSGGSSDFARYAWTSVRETRGLRYIMPLSTSWALRRPAWHHVAIVSDGSTLRVLVDGAPSGTPQVGSLGAVIGTLRRRVDHGIRELRLLRRANRRDAGLHPCPRADGGPDRYEHANRAVEGKPG